MPYGLPKNNVQDTLCQHIIHLYSHANSLSQYAKLIVNMQHVQHNLSRISTSFSRMLQKLHVHVHIHCIST